MSVFHLQRYLRHKVFRKAQKTLKLVKDKRLTTSIITHFEIQASWRYFSVLSLTGLKRNDYILPEIMSRPSKVAFMSFKRGFSEFRQ